MVDIYVVQMARLEYDQAPVYINHVQNKCILNHPSAKLRNCVFQYVCMVEVNENDHITLDMPLGTLSDDTLIVEKIKCGVCGMCGDGVNPHL